jgi:hypothetical protein
VLCIGRAGQFVHGTTTVLCLAMAHFVAPYIMLITSLARGGVGQRNKLLSWKTVPGVVRHSPRGRPPHRCPSGCDRWFWTLDHVYGRCSRHVRCWQPPRWSPDVGSSCSCCAGRVAGGIGLPLTLFSVVVARCKSLTHLGMHGALSVHCYTVSGPHVNNACTRRACILRSSVNCRRWWGEVVQRARHAFAKRHATGVLFVQLYKFTSHNSCEL